MSNPRQYPLVLGVNSKNQADQLIEASALKLDSLVVSSISATEFLGLNLTGINITVPTGVYITTAIYYEGTGTFLPKPTNSPTTPVVTVYNPNTGTTNDSFPYAVNTTGPATAVSLWTYQGLRDRFFEIPNLPTAGVNILTYDTTEGEVDGVAVQGVTPGYILGHDGAGHLAWVQPATGNISSHLALTNVLVDVTSPATTVSHWTYQALQDLFIEPSELSVYATTATTALVNYVRINSPSMQTITGPITFNAAVCGIDALEIPATTLGSLTGVQYIPIQQYVQFLEDYQYKHVVNFNDLTATPASPSHWRLDTLKQLFLEPTEVCGIYATTAEVATINTSLQSHLNATGPSNDPHPQYTTDAIFNTHSGTVNVTSPNTTVSHWTYQRLQELFMEPGEMGIYTTTADFNQATGTLVSHSIGSSDGDGTILYYDTDFSKFVALPIGSTDQVLKVVGGLPVWATQATGTSTVQVLDDLTDVAITSPTSQHILRYSGATGPSAWINTQLGHSNLSGVVLDSTAVGQVGHYTIEFLNARYVQPATTALVNYFTTGEADSRFANVAGDTFTGPVVVNSNFSITGNAIVTGTTTFVGTVFGIDHSELQNINVNVTSPDTTVSHWTFKELKTLFPLTTEVVGVYTPLTQFNQATATLTPTATLSNYTQLSTFNQATSVLATTASLTNYTLTSTFNQATSVLTPTATFVQATSLLTPTSIFYSTTATLNNNFVNYTPTATFNQATAVLTPTSTFVQATATLNNRFVNYTLTSTYNAHAGDPTIHFTVDSFAPNFTTTGTFYSTTALLTPLTTFNQATSVLATTASLANYTLTSTFNQATSILATTASLTNYTLTSVFNQATALLTPTATFIQATATLLPKTGGTITGPLVINSNFNVTGNVVITGTTTFVGNTFGIGGAEVLVDTLGNSEAVGAVGEVYVTGFGWNNATGPGVKFSTNTALYLQQLDGLLYKHVFGYVAPTGTTAGHWTKTQITDALTGTFLNINATGNFITTANLVTRVEQQVSLGNISNVEIAGFYELTDGDVLSYKDGLWINAPQTQTSFWDPSQFQESIIGPEAGQILILSGDLSSIDRSFTNISSVERHLSGLYGVPGSSIHHHLSSLDQRYLPASGVFSGVVAVQALSSVDYIDFDLSANVEQEEGRLYWNDTYKTLELDSSNQTSIFLGQEVVVRVLNNTAQTFTRGQVVYISGTASNIPTIALATASAEATTHKGLGVLKQTLGPNDRGLMSIFGKVSGIDTSIYNIGDILYLGTTPGSLTNVYTAAPSHPELIGSVVTVGTSSTGVVLVQVQHGYEMQELHNVSRTEPSATGQVLVWNNTGGYYAPGSHNDLAGLTTGNPHTQYATLSGATFTGPVKTLSSLSVGTSSTVSPLTLSGALTLYQSSPGTRIYDYRDSSGNNLYYSQWDGSNFHHYYGVSLYHNLNGRQIAFEGNGNVNSRIRITGTTAMWLDPSIDGSTQAFRIGAGTYATSAVPLITTTFATCRTWAWNGSNGSTLGSDMGMTFKQTSAVNDSARFTIFTKLSNGTTKEDFNLLTNGNVGIGSINPSATLHVDSTTTQDILNLHNSGISRFSISNDGRVIIGGSLNTWFKQYSLGIISLGSASADQRALLGINTIVPSTGFFGIGSNITIATVADADVRLNRDAAGVLAQRNDTAAQAFRIYNTYTAASSYERVGLNWNANAFEIETEASGTGIARNLIIGTSGTPRMVFSGTGARIDTSGMFVAGIIYPNNQTTYSIRNDSNRIEFYANNSRFFASDSQSAVVIPDNGKYGFGPGDPNAWIYRVRSGTVGVTSALEALSSITAPIVSATSVTAINGLTLGSNQAITGGGTRISFNVGGEGIATVTKDGTKRVISLRSDGAVGFTDGTDPANTDNLNTFISRASQGVLRVTSSIEALSSITANIRMSTPALSATNISGVNSLSATNVTGANIYGTSAYISTVSATTYKNLPVNQRIIPITILNPSSITYYPLFYAKYMANIEEVNSVLVGGTSVTWSIWLASDVSDPTTGTQLYDSKITNSLTTGNTETGVSISEGWVVLEVVGYSGSVDQLQLTFITD